MNKSEQITRLRTRKMAALILDARTAMRRTPAECAAAMNISSEEYQAFETGVNAPTLPELEALAYFLDIPLEHFWNHQSLSKNTMLVSTDNGKRLRQLRNRAIGAQLRQKRMQANREPADIAAETELPVELLEKYETGQAPIPLPHLEILANLFKMPLADLFDQHGPIGEWRSDQDLRQKFSELPSKMKDFISKPVNRPYIELAMRLSELSVERLRLVAESLLEITY